MPRSVLLPDNLIIVFLSLQKEMGNYSLYRQNGRIKVKALACAYVQPYLGQDYSHKHKDFSFNSVILLRFFVFKVYQRNGLHHGKRALIAYENIRGFRQDWPSAIFAVHSCKQ